eukprot:scaffold59335_cov32-Phaeocystis_antarctica.AAC.2
MRIHGADAKSDLICADLGAALRANEYYLDCYGPLNGPQQTRKVLYSLALRDGVRLRRSRAVHSP